MKFKTNTLYVRIPYDSHSKQPLFRSTAFTNF